MIHWFRFASLLFFILGSAPLSAQKTTDLKKQGETFYFNGRWTEALDAFSRYQEKKPGEQAVLSKLGICCYRLHQGEKARQWLEYAISLNPKTAEPETYYFLARTLHGLSEFEQAVEAYKQFLRAAPLHMLRDNAKDNIRRCVNGLYTPANDAVALVENLGDRVNTAGDEFAPLPSVNFPNRLYFSAARPGCTGGLRDDDGYEDNKAGRWCSDMFITNRSNSGWDEAKALGGLQNTSRCEVALDFSKNGRILYFSRGFTSFSGEIYTDTAGLNDEYAAQPRPFLSSVQAEEGDGALFYCNDTTLLFSSRRPGGQGGLDLYAGYISGGVWSEPHNLGAVVNSPYDETTPFLSADGRTLYFSSNRPGSIGGLDIFKSVFDPEQKTWSPPVNIGAPLNSPGDDAFFRLSADGKTAYFSSDRLDSYGERDLYIAYYKEEQAEQLETAPIAFLPDKAPQAIAATPDEAQTGHLTPLFYDTERNVLSQENAAIVNRAAEYLRNNPDLVLLVTAHTDENGPVKFDLYNGIKRAEQVGKALTERGIPANRLVLYSAGPYYPLARNVIDAAPSPEGRKLNRRIELQMTSLAPPTPMPGALQRPGVDAALAADAVQRWDEINKGLCYKVEAAVTRQVLTADALDMFNDVSIESEPNSGAYKYTAGAVSKYAEALKLMRELQGQGFGSAAVSAYVNGIRISKAQAVTLLKKYPDLAAFIKG